MATLPTIAPEQTPKLSYRANRKFEMRETSFSKDVDESINHWLHEQVETRRKQLERRHKNLVPEWRRIGEGKPREEKKSWPFENCANLVHQVVGEANDDMAARVMGIVWGVPPIISYRYFTKSNDQQESEHNSKKSKILEQAMDYFAYEPNELDLYAKENIWFSTSSLIGTAWMCCAPEKRIESVYIGYAEGKGTKFEEDTLYEGPKVINLRDEDVLYDPDADTPEESDFISRRVTLTRRQLQEREFKGHYKKGQVALIIGKPDRYGPDENRKRENKRKGITDTEDKILSEWDIEECYFYWYHNRKKFRLIAWYHYETKTVMNQVFNFIPENQIPLVRTRLSSGEKGMNGRGLADIGKDAQDEISTAKNQRTDSITWGMLGLNRVNSMNKNIDRNLKVFPGACLPFGEKDFEHYDVGSPAMASLSMENEAAMIAQARERFGIGPAVAGAGAGQMDKKGRYQTGATFMALSDGNTRVNHRTSDFRHSHVKLFGLLTDMYGAMGLGRKGSLFGLDDKLLGEALNDYLERKVKIPMRAATASANKEITKQNELILNQAMGMYIKETSSMIQAIENGSPPPHYKKWLTSIVKSRTRLMQQIIRDFQLSDQPEEYVPEIEFPQEQPNGGANAQAQGSDPRLAAVAALIRQRGGGAAPGKPAGVGAAGGGPQGSGGEPVVPPGA